MMYRRFGMLHSRLLLHKQDRLRALEDELAGCDLEDARTEEGRMSLRCREEDEDRDLPAPPRRSRTQILEETEKVLRSYGSNSFLLSI